MTKERRERLEDAVCEEIKRHGCTNLTDDDLEKVAWYFGVY